MHRFFTFLYTSLEKRKTLLFVILIILVATLGYLACHLKMDEDIMSIIPKNETTHKVNFVFQNMNATDKIIVKLSQTDTINGTDPDWLCEQAERLADSLHLLLEENLAASLFYKTDDTQMHEMLHFLLDNIPYFLNQDDYRRIDSMLTPQKIAETLQENKELLTSPIGMVYRDALLYDPLHLSQSLLRELTSFQVESQYITYNGYLFTKDQNGLMFFITPAYSSSDTYHSKLLINKLESILAHFSTIDSSTAIPDLQLTYFGAAAVAVTNADQIKKDSTYSMIIALTVTILLLFLYFRNFKYLMLLLLPLCFGGLLSLAALYLIKGEISAIAIGTGAIILGIAIDYSLHFLIHLKIQNSVKQTLIEITSPLIVGSTTTIAAFVSLIFLKSELLEDFGLFAAFTLIGTILFTLIFLPHFTGKKRVHYHVPHYSIWNRIANYSFEDNKYVIIGIAALTVLFAFFAGNVRFEDDMNKINYMTDAQHKAFAELSQNTTLSKQLTYFAATGAQLETALQNYEKAQPVLQKLNDEKLLLSCQGVGRLLPSQQLQQQKIAQWNTFWEKRKDDVINTLNRESLKCGFKAGSFVRFETLLHTDFYPRPCHYFLDANKQLLSEFIIDTPEKSVILSLLYSNPTVTPQIEKELSWNPDNFCFDSKTLTRSMLNELSFDFNYLLWICCLIVFIFLFISFGRIELTLLTFAPMAIAFIWILGMMTLFDIRFNIINIILTTFIFGIGDDYSIFIMEGLMYEYAYGKKMLSSYKTAVILSAVTMFVGIGALIIARHPAMFSLAQVTIIGMITVAIIAYTVAPFIFKWLTMKNGKKRRMPITLWNLTKTCISFLIFLICAIVLTLIGFFLLTIGRKNRANTLRFHKCICSIFRILSKIMFQVPVKILNQYHETFEKPGIIICNHQSHLDLMYTLLLSPKIICLTNEWVWKNPFYGWILRYADFYPIANNMEQSVEQLQTAIANGYSILIFPEGTRSADCSIGRFHKGAFYLANQLQVDIIPLVVHGIGHFFPKNEFMSRKGRVTVQILERIGYNDARRSEKEYYEIAKTIRHFYIDAYRQLAKECETASYFVDLVKHNYLYKGSHVARAVRRSLKKNHYFEDAIAALPDYGTYHIDHCGYGEFPLLAALVKKHLQITASDPDQEKLLLAAHCAAVPDNLKYTI